MTSKAVALFLSVSVAVTLNGCGTVESGGEEGGEAGALLKQVPEQETAHTIQINSSTPLLLASRGERGERGEYGERGERGEWGEYGERGERGEYGRYRT